MPIAQQTMRLEALLSQPGKSGARIPPDWTPEQVAQAASMLDYLQNSPDGGPKLTAIFARYGMDFQPGTQTSASVLEQLGYKHPAYTVPVTYIVAQRDTLTQPVDVSATPILLGNLTIYPPGQATVAALFFEIADNRFRQFNQIGPEIDLTDWIARQSGGPPVDPWIDFTIGDRNYRYVIDSMSADLSEDGRRTLTHLSGTLFASATPTP